MRNLVRLGIILSLGLVGCGIYSYTSEMRVNTISVSRIKNNIKTHSPTIDYEITSRLEDKFSKQYDLELVDKNGDYQISGSITSYSIEPFSIGANNVVYLNRVNMEISVQLFDRFENRTTTRKKIIVFSDYDSKWNFGKIKDSINNILTEKAAEEIYNELFLRL